MQLLTKLTTQSPQAIFFDLDGTLLDSAPDLAAATNDMLIHFSLPKVSLTSVSKWIGNGAPTLITRTLKHISNQGTPVPEHAEAMSVFNQCYSHVQGQHSVLYPGVLTTLQTLKSAKIKLAVITNKPGLFTPQVLSTHHLTEFFDLVLSGDSLAHKKPHPLPINHALEFFNVKKEQAIMVGDSENDINAANSAGVASICVTYGYNHGNDPLTLSATRHISQFSQLVE